MTLLGLLRHGEVEGGNCLRGHTDDPLTSNGLDQMWNSVENNQNWSRVIASPLKRCAEFASAFANHNSIPLELNENLMEMNFGEWEGRSTADLMDESPNLLANFWKDPDLYPPPGGEALSRFEARVLQARDSIVDLFAEQRILLVTHGGVIRVLLCHARRMPVRKLLDIDVKHGAMFTLRTSIDANQTRFIEAQAQT